MPKLSEALEHGKLKIWAASGSKIVLAAASVHLVEGATDVHSASNGPCPLSAPTTCQ